MARSVLCLQGNPEFSVEDKFEAGETVIYNYVEWIKESAEVASLPAPLESQPETELQESNKNLPSGDHNKIVQQEEVNLLKRWKNSIGTYSRLAVQHIFHTNDGKNQYLHRTTGRHILSD